MSLNWWQRLVLAARGRVRLRLEKRPGWVAPMPIYLCHCQIHGIDFEDYPHGWKEETECPVCLELRAGRFREALRRLEATQRG